MRNKVENMKRFALECAVEAARRQDSRIAGQLPSTKGQL
jgi:hypothetical protein